MTLLPNAVTGLAEVAHPDYPNTRIPAFVLVPSPDGMEVSLSTAQRLLLESLNQSGTDQSNALAAINGVMASLHQLVGQIKANNTDAIASDTADLSAHLQDVHTTLNSIQEVVNVIQQSQGSSGTLNGDVATTKNNTTAISSSLGTVITRLTELITVVNSLSVAVNDIDSNVSLIRSDVNRLRLAVPENETISIINMASANQQYAFNLSAGTTRWALKTRGGPSDPKATLRYAWFSGRVLDGNCDYIAPSYQEVSQNYFQTGRTLYLATDTPSTVAIMKTWS